MLASDSTHFEQDDIQALKFHGTYQQDDRDVRRQRRAEGLEKAYMFMVRVAIPGGILTAEQYLTLDRLADLHGNGSLRITTRQGFQLHKVLKRSLKATIAGINETLLTTLAACGDVSRNVMACPAPLGDEAHVMVRRTAREIAEDLRPSSGAYHEIWLDGEKQATSRNEEPFYGNTYLPRKFKVGVALADDNCVDVYSYDLGLIAIIEQGKFIGYNVVVGGGAALTHGKADTFARLAQPLGFIDAEHAAKTARAVVSIFRDFGDRADRRHARLKYLLANWGIERFRDELHRRVSFELRNWYPIPPPECHDHLGLGRQDDGRMFYGIFAESGRIVDREGCRIKTALRQVIADYRPGVTLTPQQNLLLTGLDVAAAAEIERALSDHGVAPVSSLSAVRRHTMACPALPTCGLALADSERAAPSFVARIEKLLVALGVGDVPISLRVTGCPNGCARPYTADISFVGRRPGVYHVYVGGGLSGDRLVDLFAADVASEDLVTVLQPLLESWAAGRLPREGLGDYYQRMFGRSGTRSSISGSEEPTAELFQAESNLLRQSALVLVAHGSHDDPGVNRAITGYARQVARRLGYGEVVAAFVQGEPGIATVLDTLSAEDVVVLPVMTSEGYFSKVFVEAELRKNDRFDRVRIRWTAPVGAHPAIPSLVIARIDELLRSNDLDPSATSLVIVGHGSESHQQSRSSTMRLAEALRRRRGSAEVLVAFLDQEPYVETIPESATMPCILAMPFLIGAGRHAAHDVPTRLGISVSNAVSPPYKGRVGERLILCDRALGSDPGLVEIIADLAREASPQRTDQATADAERAS